jgi:hypothetical protein
MLVELNYKKGGEEKKRGGERNKRGEEKKRGKREGKGGDDSNYCWKECPTWQSFADKHTYY